MYGVFHRRRFLWGVLIALLCLLLPFLGGVAARKTAQRARERLPAQAVMQSLDGKEEITGTVPGRALI